VELDPAREIVVTASGVQALNLGIRCALDPGDEASCSRRHGPTAAPTRCSQCGGARDSAPACGERYRIDFDALERTVNARTRLLVYTSPSNPLAGWRRNRSSGAARFRAAHGLWLLADEVYDRLYYGGAQLGEPVPSILRKATRDDA